jgi:hypothetical protein
LILRCLEKEPSNRFHDGAELVRALRSLYPVNHTSR